MATYENLTANDCQRIRTRQVIYLKRWQITFDKK